MPLYGFEDKDGNKTEFYFPIKEYPKFGQKHIDEDGKEWTRVFTAPNVGYEKINPNDPNDFVNKTANKKGSYGDLLDASKELSEKRAKANGGEDPVQKKFFENYKKTRHGVQHLEEKKKKKVDKDGFGISYT